MNLNGIYVGKVEAVNDPEKLGRVKVRVPHVYGILGSAVGQVPLDDLPWAIPLGLPAGQSQQSGGMDWLPEPGDQVAVQFLDGEPEKPVWAWFMQTTTANEDFPLHQYEAVGPSQGKPKRSALTRYGHTVEWTSGSIVLTTSKGYRLFALDATSAGSDGYLQLITQSGQFLELNDETQGGLLNILEDFYMQIGLELNIQANSIRVETMSGDLDMTIAGNTNLDFVGDVIASGDSGLSATFVNNFEVTANQINLTAQSSFVATAPLLRIGSESAVEPAVKGIQFTTWVASLLAWLGTHTHTSATPGTPTSPPQVPPTVIQPQSAQLISQKVFVE